MLSFWKCPPFTDEIFKLVTCPPTTLWKWAQVFKGVGGGKRSDQLIGYLITNLYPNFLKWMERWEDWNIIVWSYFIFSCESRYDPYLLVHYTHTHIPVASIVLLLLIIFCLLKWEPWGKHFGYIYIIFGYWNESRGACTLHICTSSLATEMRAEGHALCICTSSLHTENMSGGRGTRFRYVHHLCLLLKWVLGQHGTPNMTHPWAKCLISWFPMVDGGDKASQPLGPCFFSSLSCKIRNEQYSQVQCSEEPNIS